MRLPGTTPSAPDDHGGPDPRLLAALATGDAPAIAEALLLARLLVPVVALPGTGDAEMAVPALVADDGSRALPVFSSYDALRAWQPTGRPVPMVGARVLAAAEAEGYAGVVLDVAGPISHTVTGRRLATLAAAARALAANPSASVHILPPTPPPS